MDYYCIVHPEVSEELKRLRIRSIWEDSYREYRKARPLENIGPREILKKFSDGIPLAGGIGRLCGVRFS